MLDIDASFLSLDAFCIKNVKMTDSEEINYDVLSDLQCNDSPEIFQFSERGRDREKRSAVRGIHGSNDAKVSTPTRTAEGS